ncbi:MAG: ferrous iron transport protein A [Acidobacteriia bacterium]|jgi:Fe2+ transport system protein FeoA|nr:ferrous iron transport protein A [Terriglobia bacterium]
MAAPMNLYQLQPGSVMKISLISGGWGARRNLNQIGLHVGDKVSVIHKAPFGGPLVVENRGSRVAMGRRLAEKVEVEALR